MSTQDKETAFKVTAKQGRKVVAEYIFANMLDAITFEVGMKKEGYNTKMEAIYVWDITSIIHFSCWSRLYFI